MRTKILHAEPLPEYAVVGQQGLVFDHTVVPASKLVEPATSDTVSDTVMWSLEPWGEHHALWCNRIRPSAGGPPSEEGYVIRPDGTIDAALIGGWMADPAGDGAGRSFRFVLTLVD